MMKKVITTLAGHYVNAMASLAPQTAGRHGFRLFCYPARVRLKDHQQEFLDTAEKFSFQHQQIRIQAYRWGNGPKKVLFLHGWQSHSFRWKNYIQALPAEEYSIYAFDAPGHGLSGGSFLSLPLYSDVMLRFMKTLGVLDCVVSHSIGSFSMLYTLFRESALPVKKLVVMGVPGEVSDFIQVYRKTLNLSDRAVSHTLGHFVKAVGNPVDFFSAARFAAAVQIPGLIIHDKEDWEAPYFYALRVQQAWKKAQLLTTEGLGHNLRSNLVVEAVCEYIRGNYSNASGESIKANKQMVK